MGGYMSTISASTTTTTAYKVTADTTGTLVLQTGATPTTALTISSAQVVSLAQVLPEASGGTGTTTGYYGFKNRIINGAMVIDQRNAGAAISTAGGGYPTDRWQIQYSTGTLTLQQSSQVPTGFTNSISITVTSAGTRLSTDYFLLNQKIEGYNFADFGFGSAGAATVTISFWVRSSVTGTYSGVLASGDNTRTYPFTYTINSSNTWEQKTVTIAGDTSGGTTAYPTTNGIGCFVKFDLGSGSNYEVASAGSWQAATNKIGVTSQTGFAQTGSATFYITGVQLEKGSTATSFDYRPYGTELALCQRYYQQYSHAPLRGVANSSTTLGRGGMVLPVVMRSAPSVTITTAINWYDGAGTGTITSISTNYSTTTSCEFDSTFATGTTAQFRPIVIYNSSTGALNLSSEL